MSVPIVHQPGAGEASDVGSIRFVLKAGAGDTSGAFSFIEATGPTFATPHVHHDREETFYVVEGSFTFLCGEDRVEATAGSFLLVPRGTMHGFRASEDGRRLIIHSPGGFEGFFREMFARIGQGQWDRATRDRFAAEYGLTYHDDITI